MIQFTTTKAPVPPAPNLKAPANNARDLEVQITLVWDIVSNATGYDWEVLQAGKVVRNGQTTGRDATTVKVTMDNEKTYTWRVRARRDASTGPWSASWQFTTAAKPLAAPKLKAPVNKASNVPVQVDLVWEAVTGATGYQWEVLYAGKLFRNGQTAGRDTTTVKVTVDNDKTYTWRVRARRDASTGPWSASWQFTTVKPPTPPKISSPKDKNVDVGTWNNGSRNVTVSIVWTSVGGASGYDLQVCTSSQFTGASSVRCAGTSHSLNLAPATTYYARVASVVGGQRSSWSPVIQFTTVKPPAAITLTNPKNNANGVGTLDGAGSVTVKFQWTSVSGTAQYELQVATSDEFTSPQVVRTASLTAELSLECSTTYYARVAPLTAGMDRAWSSVNRFVTASKGGPIVIPPTPVSPPRIVSPKDGTANVDVGDSKKESATGFSWERVGETPEKFVVEIYRGKTLNPSQKIAEDPLPGSTTHHTKLLEPLRYYVWRVAAVDAKGEYHWSSKACFSTEGYQVTITKLEWLTDYLRVVWTPHRGEDITYQVEVEAHYLTKVPPASPDKKVYDSTTTERVVPHADFPLKGGAPPHRYVVRVRATVPSERLLAPWSLSRSIEKRPGGIIVVDVP